MNTFTGRQAIRINVTDDPALCCQLQQLCLRRQQGSLATVSPILQEQTETGRGTQLIDGRWHQAHHRTFDVTGHSLLRQFSFFRCTSTISLIPVFEHGERHRGIGAGTGKAETKHHHIGIERRT